MEKSSAEQLEYERQREIERLHTELPRVIDNRHERRRQAAIAKRRAKVLIKQMRAQGVDFIHDKS